MEKSQLCGLFAVNKPKGPTSFDVVRKIKRITGEKKVGHAGTLDPLAQGVLVLGVGREATRKLDEIVQKEKEYIAQINLEMFSETDDEEGSKTMVKVTEIPSKEKIQTILEKHTGSIVQTSPRYSAVKISGKEAYKRARKGEKFTLPKRFVEIKKIETLEYAWPFLKLRVVTGPGVYIRSLARELGEDLGTGGYLTYLLRTRVGQFDLENAISFDELNEG